MNYAARRHGVSILRGLSKSTTATASSVSRYVSSSSASSAQPAAPSAESRPAKQTPPSFPCVDAHAARELRLSSSPYQTSFSSPPLAPSSTPDTGPEPPYARPNPTSYNIYHHADPFPLIYSPDSPLPEFDIAYETWGTLSPSKDNAILLHTGLSASSHAASTTTNPSPGWWEKYIGPGKALDTNQFFVICTNVLGGCYGSTGPSSVDPSSENGKDKYGTNFPVLSIFDMVKAQWLLVDHLGIDKLYASVGSSMGGMSSLVTGWLHPERVGKVVSISGTARSSPGSVAMRGFYYDGMPPHTGMKLARQIATITYRSGPEWDQRFGRKLRDPSSEQEKQVAAGKPRSPLLCPDFLIETYLDHQGEQFCLKYDANSLIYISKAMDLFDMTDEALSSLNLTPPAPVSRSSLPDAIPASSTRTPLHISPPPSYISSLASGLAPLSKTPTLILGVQSDILFPVEQQRELADALRMAGNNEVVYYELGGVWGHDTFLIDVGNVGGAIRGFLS